MVHSLRYTTLPTSCVCIRLPLFALLPFSFFLVIRLIHNPRIARIKPSKGCRKRKREQRLRKTSMRPWVERALKGDLLYFHEQRRVKFQQMKGWVLMWESSFPTHLHHRHPLLFLFFFFLSTWSARPANRLKRGHRPSTSCFLSCHLPHLSFPCSSSFLLTILPVVVGVNRTCRLPLP